MGGKRVLRPQVPRPPVSSGHVGKQGYHEHRKLTARLTIVDCMFLIEGGVQGM